MALKKELLRKCGLFKTGPVSYEQGLLLQTEARVAVAAGEWDGILLLVEHLPVITFGRSGGEENLCTSAEVLTAQGVDIVFTDRGGNITCHNPGQIVGYPVLNLHKWKPDVHWYVHAIEEVIIKTLAYNGLRTGRKARYTGVWLEDEKIAAIGISVKQWVTGHGFALNVDNNLELFHTIMPCGIREFGVTSIAKAGIETSIVEMKDRIATEFSRVFQCELIQEALK